MTGQTITGRGGLRFVLLFALLFGALQLGLVKTRSPIADWLVAAPAGWTLAKILPDDRVAVQGNQVHSQRVRLNILPGCEGTEVFFLLIAGVLAFPTSWRNKLRGLALGLPLAFGLNVARVIALYFTVRDAPAQFELVHGYVAPTALVACLGVFFWLWSARATSPPLRPAI
jgi:exosortase family protein XrtM